MASRYAAARPRRAGEVFARQHHGGAGDGEGSDDEGGASGAAKKVTFDVRNPSALAPDAREEDDVLDADVIGVATGATKRGAVNIDGYDSDSDNETFNVRAEQRKRPGHKTSKGGYNDDGREGVDLIDQLDNYDKRLKGEIGDGGQRPTAGDDDDDDDMFADEDDDGGAAENGKGVPADGDDKAAGRKKWKEVHFLDDKNIVGQEEDSRDGGHIRLDNRPTAGGDDDESSEDSADEETIALAIQEEGLDEEVGLGGLKKHAPKLEAFNMRKEQEEGAFDESGNYIRKAADPDAQHDRWLDGVSRKQMKRAAAAHEKREAELRQTRRDEDSILTADLFGALITRLELGETPLEALARLGKKTAALSKGKQTKAKRIPQWRLKQLEKKNGQVEKGADDKGDAEGNGNENGNSDEMDVDKRPTAKVSKEPEDPEQAALKANINAITEAADRLLNRDYQDIYDMERERLVREYRAETGEAWVDPPNEEETGEDAGPQMWEYRWVDGRDGGAKQGPYDGPTMKAWQDAGYFEGVEFRPAGSDSAWRQSVAFT